MINVYQVVVYYERIKGDLNKRLIYECLCDTRLKAEDEASTCHVYTRLHVFVCLL